MLSSLKKYLILAIAGVAFSQASNAASYSDETSTSARKRTLIVTHPEKLFDPEAAAGPATFDLLGADYVKKIVLTTGGEFTFRNSDANFLKVYSRVGEYVLDTSLKGQNDFTLAGGFFGACFRRTLTNLIQQVPGKVDIELSLRGTYSNLGTLIPTGDASPITLHDFGELYGESQLRVALMNYANDLYFAISEPYVGIAARDPESVQIRVLINQKLIGTVGSGADVLVLRFN